MKTSKVFVAGGQPTVTYVNRGGNKLEVDLKEALDTGYQLISITGPTKSGKTVLSRNVIGQDSAIWIGGGEIQSELEFWERIVGDLGGYEEHSETAVKNRSTTDGTAIDGSVNVGVVKLGSDKTEATTSGSAQSKIRSRRVTHKSVALELLSKSEKVLVIDDFHYIDNDLQRIIVRALKQKIFDGLLVVFLAVPHRAYDAVRVETEMTGRVRHIEIPKWTSSELKEIAEKGFVQLNVECADDIKDLLSSNSFSSPHLMQWFCNKICLENSIRERSGHLSKIELHDENKFFAGVAGATSKPAFDRLATGPRQRTDRLPREFLDGSKGDIYIAVLRSIAASGPRLTLTYEDIRAKAREILKGDVPQAHEISRVLVKMTDIAKNNIDGEPVIEWEDEQKILHIIDPFFAFYLRWGTLVRPGD